MTENHSYRFRPDQQLAEDYWESRLDPRDPFYCPMPRPNYSGPGNPYASYNFGLYLQQQQAFMTPVNPIVPDDSGSRIVCEWLMPIGQECGEVFDNPATLATHLFEAHFPSDSARICSWKGCNRNGRPFPKKYKLVTHARVHTGEQPFTCETCNKTFARSESLKTHTRTHTGEKPFKCGFENCGKTFASSSDRGIHMCIHTGEKRYQCKHVGCNKKYSQPGTRARHYKNDHKNVGSACTTLNNDDTSESDLSEVEESNKEN